MRLGYCSADSSELPAFWSVFCIYIAMFALLDTEPAPDIRAVLETAALLDTTEFDLFGLAYRDWYAQSASSTEIESFFVSYMFAEKVPMWVRQYTRKILRLAKDGPIDRIALGIKLQPANPAMVRKGQRYLMAVFVAMVGLVMLAATADELSPALAGCYFPPCY
jgi:hypothetical protein